MVFHAENKAQMEAQMDQFVAESQEASRRAAVLMESDPKLPYISAYIIARDMMGADRSLEWLRTGEETWESAEAFCGSYGRLDLRVRAHAEGLITDEQLFDDLARTWSGSDPDDTDPRFLDLWRKAYIANGLMLSPETAKLPRRKWLHVYRGQDEGAPFGVSWSLDRRVAVKFANGAATRERGRGGVVYGAIVQRVDVMAYMTSRSEDEVIVDPAHLRDVSI